jgi:LPS-assembly protein
MIQLFNWNRQDTVTNQNTIRKAVSCALSTGLLASVAVFGFLVADIRPAVAQSDISAVTSDIKLSGQKAFLGADEVWYDQKRRMVGAKGKVELFQGDKGITADQIEYYLDEEKIIAKGNVTLLEPSGNVVFAEEINLDQDLKRGYVKQIGLLLADGTRAAAAHGIRRSETIMELQKAVFSPCANCKDDPTRPLFWELGADQIILDDELQEVFYKNARFKILGRTLFRTPYMRHPDPRLDRKSGFLFPTAKYSDDLGFSAGLRYFQTLGTDTDITFEPSGYSKGGGSLAGTFRHRFDDAYIEIFGHGSYIDPSSQLSTNILESGHSETEGLLRTEGWWHINDTWRASFDGLIASDNLYAQDLDINSSEIYENKAQLEGFHGRSYTSVAAYDYQYLRDSTTFDEDTFPSTLPEASHSFISEPGQNFGEIWRADLGSRYLYRETGRDSLKVSGRLGLELPYKTESGHLFRLEGNLRGDYYDVTQVDPTSDLVNPPAPTYSGSADRFYPEGKIEWRYPLIKKGPQYSQTLEPIVSFTATPDDNDLNDGRIPNEDSANFQFDTTNLFDINRFAGTDRVEPGQKVNYGVNWSLFDQGQESLNVFVGQSYRLNSSTLFPTNSGVEDQLSDVVAHFQLRQHEAWPLGSLGEISDVKLDYLTRYDIDDEKLRRNEVYFSGTVADFTANASYLGFDLDNGSTRLEQVSTSLSYKIDDAWSVGGYYSRDLVADQSVLASSYLQYENGCFSFKLTGAREFSSNGSGYTVGAVISFSHLGVFDINGKDFSSILSEEEN